MRSDTVTKGKQQAPHRSLMNALGLTQEEMDRPLVGIVSSYNEIVPGHMNLDKIVNAVKQGVAMAGGTPIVFPAIAVCDGIAMGHIGMKYSLVTRDLIADSTEAMALAHQFDALVMVPNCDKNVRQRESMCRRFLSVEVRCLQVVWTVRREAFPVFSRLWERMRLEPYLMKGLWNLKIKYARLVVPVPVCILQTV
mgnify:CR=1 FL=1